MEIDQLPLSEREKTNTTKFGIQSYWLNGLGDFYNIWYNWYNKNEPAKTIVSIIDKFIRKEKNNIKILDCACGTGNPSLALRKMGYNVLSSDGSKKMLERARENAVHFGIKLNLVNKPVLWAGLTNFFQQQKFDVVVCTGNSLCHTSPYGVVVAIKQMHNILKAGGICIVDVKRYSRNIRELEYKKEKGWIERKLRVNRRHLPNGQVLKFVSSLNYKGKDKSGRTYNIELDIIRDNKKYRSFTFSVWAITIEMMLKIINYAGLKVSPIFETRNPAKWQYDFCIGMKE